MRGENALTPLSRKIKQTPFLHWGGLSRGLSQDRTRSDVEPLKNEQVCAPSGAKTPPCDFESIIEKGEVHTGTHRSHMQIFLRHIPVATPGCQLVHVSKSTPRARTYWFIQHIFLCRDSKNRLFFEKQQEKWVVFAPFDKLA